MINFKITGLDNTFISIEKPTGKAISLKLGEIVKAEVIDMLPTGGVTLKVKGDFITAKTDIPLEKGAIAFFKVTDLPVEGKDLKLQFMGYTPESAKEQEMTLPSFNLKESPIPKLIQELTNSLSDIKNSAVCGKEADSLTSKLQNINSEILKALPSDINSLPKEVRMQLQNLLQASLKITGQSIQTRLDNFISQLPEGIKNHPLVQNLTKDLTVSIEKLLQTPMKGILQDTGVALEAKLKAIVEMFQQMEYSGSLKAEAGRQEEVTILPQGKDAVTHEQKQPLQHDMTAIKKDLKAGLLQLKQLVVEDGKETLKGFPTADLTPTQREIAVRVIDGLIKDIETFQVLSKTTDSFYTFLPINWQELKDGEVSFKRGRSDAKGISYSCRINLDLERFGKLSVMVMMYNKEFLVSFRAENPAFQAILNNNAKELQDSFIARGLNLKAVNVLDSNDASLEQFERPESFENQVNIKV
ncbi:flagellar hook-length control protein FliK [Dissulfurispira sp.]|uniref:flagellar hook-length control protein FliK n=1 Tax=Dissulfurispira sp. TaxID=2817609 RepID=UPI002FD95315